MVLKSRIVLLIYVLIVARIAWQQQCGVLNLPQYGDVRNTPNLVVGLRRDMRQALVPAYSFNCSGRITQWRACVQPAEKGDTYYIQFQVWRPTGVVGCYKLVGYNAPPADVLNSRNANLSQLLEPINGCIEFSVSKNDQIKFQRGDTIGYYIDHFNPSSNNGKVQMSTSENVTIYHKRINGFSDLRSVYAIQSLGATPSNCGFVNTSVSDPDSEITSSIVGAPIISLSFDSLDTGSRNSTEGQNSGKFLTYFLYAVAALTAVVGLMLVALVVSVLVRKWRKSKKSDVSYGVNITTLTNPAQNKVSVMPTENSYIIANMPLPPVYPRRAPIALAPRNNNTSILNSSHVYDVPTSM